MERSDRQKNRSFPDVLTVFLLYIGSYFVIYLLFVMLVKAVFPNYDPGQGEGRLEKWMLGVMEIFLLAIPVLYLRWEKIPVLEAFQIRKIPWRVVGYSVLFSVGILPWMDELDRIVQWLFRFEPLDDRIFQAMKWNSSLEMVYLILTVGAVAGIVEEFLFRGLFFQAVKNRLGVIQAIIMSSVFWSILHGNVNWTLQIFLLGLILGLLVYHTGSVWPAVILHGLNNIFSLVFINLEKNPIIHLYQGEMHVQWYILIISALFMIFGAKKLFVKPFQRD